MGSTENVLAEIAGALGILGLLLVFLPLYIQRVANAASGRKTQRERKRRIAWAWTVPVLIAFASVDVTVGLLAVWGKWDTGDLTGWLLLALVWLVTALSGLTVWQGAK